MLNQSLLELESEIWNALHQATKDPKSHFRNLTLCTVGVDKTPECRIVILREVLKGMKVLEIFTDCRSKKYEEILQKPNVSLLFYEPVKQIQLRIKGTAVIHNLDTLSLSIFNDLSQQSRRLYGLEYPPGKPGEMDIQGKASYYNEDAKKNFSLVRIKTLEIDYLELAKPNHRRAIIKYDQNSDHTSTWVMP